MPCSEAELHAILDQWFGDGFIRPREPKKSLTEEEKTHPRFCRYHQFVGHPTTHCQILKRIIERKISDGTLEIASAKQGIDKDPLPRHKGKEQIASVAMAELYFQEICMVIGLQPEEIHYLSDTASSDKSGHPENNRDVPGHKRVRSFMEDQGDDSTRYQSQEESSILGAARGATLAYLVDTLDSLQEDYEVLQDEVSKLQRTVTALMSDYKDSRNNRTGSREIPSSSQVSASSRKNNEEYPAIPHSEEEIYTIVNYWLTNGTINPLDQGGCQRKMKSFTHVTAGIINT